MLMVRAMMMLLQSRFQVLRVSYFTLAVDDLLRHTGIANLSRIQTLMLFTN